MLVDQATLVNIPNCVVSFKICLDSQESRVGRNTLNLQ